MPTNDRFSSGQSRLLLLANGRPWWAAAPEWASIIRANQLLTGRTATGQCWALKLGKLPVCTSRVKVDLWAVDEGRCRHFPTRHPLIIQRLEVGRQRPLIPIRVILAGVSDGSHENIWGCSMCRPLVANDYYKFVQEGLMPASMTPPNAPPRPPTATR
jgi:hypothetical protein